MSSDKTKKTHKPHETPVESHDIPMDQTAENTTAHDGAPSHKAGKKAKADGADAAKLAALETQLEDAEKKQTELKDSLLRTAAEYDNFRRRSQKEHDAAFNNGVGYAAEQLLPILDTLDAAANAETTDEEYKKGVLMILAQCNDVFAKLGITEIEALGREFNPELHNAVMQEPADGADSGTITRVMQKGYALGERVIRHSMVAVAP